MKRVLCLVVVLFAMHTAHAQIAIAYYTIACLEELVYPWMEANGYN